jgi:catechol-2,3-dioxygenase
MPAGTMQHVALHVETVDDLNAMRDRLAGKGLAVSEPIDHGFCTSIYLQAPDHVQLEFSTLTRPLGSEEMDEEVLAHCDISAAELVAMQNPA